MYWHWQASDCEEGRCGIAPAFLFAGEGEDAATRLASQPAGFSIEITLDLNFRERELGKEDEPLLPVGNARLAEGLQAGNDEARAKPLAVRFGIRDARTADLPPACDERLRGIAALDAPRYLDMPLCIRQSAVFRGIREKFVKNHCKG